MITEQYPECNRTIADELLHWCHSALLQLEDQCLPSGTDPYTRMAVCGISDAALEIAVPRKYDKTSGHRKAQIQEPLIYHHQHIRPFIYLVLYYARNRSVSGFRTLEDLCLWAGISITTFYRWLRCFGAALDHWLVEFTVLTRTREKERFQSLWQARQKVAMEEPNPLSYDPPVSEVATSFEDKTP